MFWLYILIACAFKTRENVNWVAECRCLPRLLSHLPSSQDKGTTVMPAKSGSDFKLSLQLLSKTLTCTLLLSLPLVYLSYPADGFNTQVIYRLYVPDNFVSKPRRHCHSWLAGQ